MTTPSTPTSTMKEAELLLQRFARACVYLPDEARAKAGNDVLAFIRSLVEARDEAQIVCAEAYQVVGSMLDDLGQFTTSRAEKVLDNLAQHRQVHPDVLPWPSFVEAQPSAGLPEQLTHDVLTALECGCLWTADTEAKGRMRRACDEFRRWAVASIAAPSAVLPPQGVPIAVLRDHWLRALECDHEGKRDKPHCACCAVDLGWHPTVGRAVEAWLEHVASVGLPLKGEVPDAVWEALQRLIENGLMTGQGSAEDARTVARHRDRVRFLAAAEGVAAPSVPPFARGSWQHAVDDQLVGFGKTSEEFSGPCEAVGWLVKQVGECAVALATPVAAPSVVAALRELVTLEADGKHAGESAIEAWERAAAALAAAPVETEQPVGVAVAVTTPPGYTTAVFNASEVPPGTKVYARPTPAAGEPPGFVMVPLEPTEQMIEAGILAYQGKCEESYRAMLAARPLPGGVPTGLQRLESENADLRQWLCDVLKALGNGSGASPECSMQFLSSIPEEVRLHVAALRAAMKESPHG